MRPILSAGLLLAFTLATSPAAAAPKVWAQDWSVGSKPTVHIQVDDARVRVHAGTDGRVSSRVQYEMKRWGMVFGATSPVVVFERKGDEVWVRARDPKGLCVVGGYEEHFTVDVTVPKNVTLDVRSTDGAIECEALEGHFQLESGDGAVRATGLRGNLIVITRDGRVTLAGVDGNLRARSGDGHLNVDGRFDSLELTSRDGRVDAIARAGSRMSAAWSLESTDGKVELRIPHDIAALLDARTRDGRIRIDLPIPIGDRDRNSLTGELNGGGLPLRIRTKDGAIVLALSD